MTKRGAAHQKPSLALIGLRGSGKSTVGRQLASLLGMRFVDTDELIVQRAGRSIAEIFKEHGEAGFRHLEAEIVEELASDPQAVISVGGGALLDQENVRALKRVATLVWLTAPADVLWRRIEADQTSARSRPPLTEYEGLEEVERLLATRAGLYRAAADLLINATEGTPRDIARTIAAKLDITGPG